MSELNGKSGQRSLALRALQAALLASALAPLPALAQTAIETVTVTAERREEISQKVPISINVITSDKLDTSGVQNTLDLPQLASSLVTINGANASSFQTPFIRGVGSSSTLLGIDASVATYIDGVYQPFKAANLIDLYDIERIEILKGPQGTLFGRNATGGAINIVTNQPTDQFGARAEASYGRYDETVEKGFINAPLADGLFANLGVVARQGGDFIQNDFNGTKFGGVDSVTVNGKLLWAPSDRFEATAGVVYTNRDQSMATANATNVPGSIPVGTLPMFGGAASFTDYHADLNFNPRSTDSTIEGSLHLRYSFDDVDLVSISSYQMSHSHELLDYDSTSANVFSFNDFDRGETFTQEVQLLSTDKGPLQWILGAYYITDQQGYVPLQLLYVAPLPIDINTTNRTNGWAVFGQATYDFGEGTHLTGGLRFSQETHRLTGDETMPAVPLTLAGPIDLKKTFAKPTWRVSLDHAFTDDVMAYASYNRGFKSGGFNSTTVDPTQKPVDSEVLDAYEVGAKTQWWDHRVQLNVAAYYYDYSNIQVQRVDPSAGGAALLESAGSAYLYGFDGDLTVIPTEGLELHVGLGLEQSKYTRYDNASGYAYLGGFGVAETIDAKGTQLLFAPAVTLNLGGDYTFQFQDSSSLEIAANYAFSSHYKEVVGDGNFVRAYGVLNGSVTWNAPSDKFFLRLWGKNLTDQNDIGRLLNGTSYQKQLLQPITFGVSGGVKF
ncbi:MAG TPA: TonB-dependent receptor [Rhizomicrobium sp.]